MEYRILGPLEVRAHGRVLDLGGVRSQRILAALVLQANRPVSIERLARVAWGDDSPPTARRQVQNRVAALRRILGPQALRTVSGGYELRADVDEVDALRFEYLVRKADEATSAKLYREALELWRGPVLDGLVPDRDVAALEERRLGALERCIERELPEGRPDQLIVELTELVVRHPLRQRLVGLLMTALYRAGRQAEALTAYRELAARLAEATGLDPNAELQRLHVEMLRADEPARVPERSPHTLPRAIPDFVGREGLISQALAQNSYDLVLIDGMAGAGKTALAVRVAHLVADRYPDARLFLDLHGHSDRDPVEPATALETLLRQLGVPAERIPEGLDDRVALWRTEMVDRRALLVLDNARDSTQVAPLLPGGPSCLVLVTSRRRLAGLDGAWSLSVDALSPEEAVALLTRVVGDRVTADPSGAAEVARLCGYLPLALRLAAARLAHRPQWNVGDVAARLRDGVAVAAERRTVRTAFDLSYRQLGATAQLVFRRLGLHPAGEFGEYVVAALADLPLAEAREALEELVDSHLLESPSVSRYRLHDLLREYAAGLSGDDPQREAALRRMCDFYIHATAAATRWLERLSNRVALAPPSFAVSLPAIDSADDAVAWLDVERRNVLAAMGLAEASGRHGDVWLCGRVLWPCLYVMGYADEQIRTQTMALASATVLGDAAKIGTAHNYLAAGYWRRGRNVEALHHLDQALQMRRAMNDPHAESHTLTNIAGIQIRLGQFAEAVESCRRAIEIFLELGNTEGVGVSHQGLGIALTYLGRYDESLAHLRHGLLLSRRGSAPTERANAVVELGHLRLRRGQFSLAVLFLRRARRMKRDLKDRYGEAEALILLGAGYAGLGRYEEAVRAQREALAMMADLGSASGGCLALNELGRTLTAIGRFDEAAELHAGAAEHAERIGNRYELARAHDGRAAALVATDPGSARSHWRTALQLYTETQVPERRTVAERLAELDR